MEQAAAEQPAADRQDAAVMDTPAASAAASSACPPSDRPLDAAQVSAPKAGPEPSPQAAVEEAPAPDKAPLTALRSPRTMSLKGLFAAWFRLHRRQQLRQLHPVKFLSLFPMGLLLISMSGRPGKYKSLG